MKKQLLTRDKLIELRRKGQYILADQLLQEYYREKKEEKERIAKEIKAEINKKHYNNKKEKVTK